MNLPHKINTLKLVIEYDEDCDILTVGRIRYTGSLMREIGFGKTGRFLRLEERRDGTVTMRMFSPELEKQFEQLANLKPIAP